MCVLFVELKEDGKLSKEGRSEVFEKSCQEFATVGKIGSSQNERAQVRA